MKCGAYIYEEFSVTRHTLTKRGETGIAEFIEAVRGPKTLHGVTAEDFNICDGVIVASVEAEDYPHFGGTSACLDIGYKCDKCGTGALANCRMSGTYQDS